MSEDEAKSGKAVALKDIWRKTSGLFGATQDPT
jgi:hypothetical protein